MSAVSETIVRENFELNGFLIRQQRKYQKSDLLQVIRVLKNYDFFKEPQLELFKSKRRRKPKVVSKTPRLD